MLTAPKNFESLVLLKTLLRLFLPYKV